MVQKRAWWLQVSLRTVLVFMLIWAWLETLHDIIVKALVHLMLSSILWASLIFSFFLQWNCGRKEDPTSIVWQYGGWIVFLLWASLVILFLKGRKSVLHVNVRQSRRWFSWGWAAFHIKYVSNAIVLENNWFLRLHLLCGQHVLIKGINEAVVSTEISAKAVIETEVGYGINKKIFFKCSKYFTSNNSVILQGNPKIRTISYFFYYQICLPPILYFKVTLSGWSFHPRILPSPFYGHPCWVDGEVGQGSNSCILW